jgi:hypothetical protein
MQEAALRFPSPSVSIVPDHFHNQGVKVDSTPAPAASEYTTYERLMFSLARWHALLLASAAFYLALLTIATQSGFLEILLVGIAITTGMFLLLALGVVLTVAVYARRSEPEKQFGWRWVVIAPALLGEVLVAPFAVRLGIMAMTTDVFFGLFSLFGGAAGVLLVGLAITKLFFQSEQPS